MYVYILHTTNHHPKKYYIGKSKQPKQRLAEHNQGKCKHTSHCSPWAIKNLLWFSDAKKAHSFEKYLKSGTGRAFIKKHF